MKRTILQVLLIPSLIYLILLLVLIIDFKTSSGIQSLHLLLSILATVLFITSVLGGALAYSEYKKSYSERIKK